MQAAIRDLGERSADGKRVIVQIDKQTLDGKGVKIEVDPNSLRIVLDDPPAAAATGGTATGQ